MPTINEFGIHNTLLDNQLHQIEMLKKGTQILGSDFLQQYAMLSSGIQAIGKSPMLEWITQKMIGLIFLEQAQKV